MPPRLYSIGFFLLLCFLVLLEYLINPPLLYEGDTSIYEDQKSTLEHVIKKKPLTSLAFDSFFENAGMLGVTHQPAREIDHLFHLVSLDAEKNNFRVAETDYFLPPEKSQQPEKILVTYDIFSTEPRTIFSAYTDLKHIIQRTFLYNPEVRLIEKNTYGDKSFIIRLEGNQKTMYLVVAYRDRLLGFEYPLENTRLRHDDIQKILSQIFAQ